MQYITGAVSVGDILRIRKSKRDGKPIAYAPNGKVVIIKNKDEIHFGYGEVLSITEK